MVTLDPQQEPRIRNSNHECQEDPTPKVDYRGLKNENTVLVPIIL